MELVPGSVNIEVEQQGARKAVGTVAIQWIEFLGPSVILDGGTKIPVQLSRQAAKTKDG